MRSKGSFCPECQHPLKIVKTCLTEKNIRLRRRSCDQCGYAYWSMQYPEVPIPDKRIKYKRKWHVELLDYIRK
jgi:transcriptional regulator NrdR family protein